MPRLATALALALAAGLGAGLAGPARGWAALGHEVACDIAFREVGAATRTEILRLLRLATEHRTFASACTWADRARDDGQLAWSKPFHYLNVPRGAPGPRLERDCVPQGCVLAGVYQFAGVLGDPGTPPADRLQALKFLAHFVADLHQPLHVSHAEDRGGNLIEVRFFGEPSNLHRVWDHDMLERRGGAWRELGATLQRRIGRSERLAWGGGSPLAWAQESLDLARSPALRYRDAPAHGLELGGDYLETNYATLERRLQQAGYRLARLLDALLVP